MKNILVICSSLRKIGNSNTLALEFAKGAKDGGNNVEIVYLADKTIGYCKGCLSCQKTQKCVISDDAVEIAEKMKNADVIAFATPIYYYSICGQLKTLLDRANPLYSSNYKFRKIYLLATATEDLDETVKGAQTTIQGWIDCFEKVELSDVIFAGGVTNVGDVKGHEMLRKAYETAKNIK